LNQNLFNFNGTVGESSHVYSKGFHMDINAVDIISNQSEFEVGAGKFQSPEDVLIPGQTYSNILNRKFTLVPAGGFDGWTSKLQYYPNSLNPQEVWNIYTQGYSSWSSMFSTYQLQVSLVENGTTQSTFTI
jgi:hypothetical protein